MLEEETTSREDKKVEEDKLMIEEEDPKAADLKEVKVETLREIKEILREEDQEEKVKAKVKEIMEEEEKANETEEYKEEVTEMKITTEDNNLKKDTDKINRKKLKMMSTEEGRKK